MITLGNFRAPDEGETAAAYFKAAIFKASKLNGVPATAEGKIQSFVSHVLDTADGDQTKLSQAYHYAIARFNAGGKLRLSADEALVAQAA